MEVKFKAKTEKNDWVYGTYHYSNDGKYHYILNMEKFIDVEPHFCYLHEKETHLVDGETVCQFIGVTDTNKIDVYKGDRVKGRYMVQRSLDPNAEPEIIHFEGVIKYAEGCFYVKADNGQCVFSFTYPDYELEVVGNEFEGVA